MAEPTTAIPKGGDGELPELEDNQNRPAHSPETSSALDELLKGAGVDPEGNPLEQTDAEKEDAKRKADEDAAAKLKADEEAEAARLASTQDGEAKRKADEDAAAKLKADEEAKKAAAAPKDDFDKVELPPHSKPKAAEAFAQVKDMARARATEDAKTITDLTAKLAASEEKTKAGLPPETKQELEELRKFRAQMDVESDPSFKEWDTKVKENETAIYDKLKQAGMDEKALARIVELGGPAEIDWDSVAEKLPAPVKRYIDAKLVENEDLIARKGKALAKAKENAQAFVQERQKQSETSGTARKTAVEKSVAELTPKLPWLADKVAPANADAAAKKEVEEHNKFMVRVRADIKEALDDDSPEMKGILILGFAQLHKARADYETLKASSAAEKAALEKDLKEAKDMLERIKKSTTTRLRDSSAPPSDAPKTAPKVDVHENGSSALDRHMAEIVAAQP